MSSRLDLSMVSQRLVKLSPGSMVNLKSHISYNHMIGLDWSIVKMFHIPNDVNIDLSKKDPCMILQFFSEICALGMSFP